MDGRGKRRARVSNFLDFDSASKRMDGIDSNLVMEVPDTPDRLAMRRRNNLRWDLNLNRDPVRRTYATRSRHSGQSNLIASGNFNSPDDDEFLFREATLARSLADAAETKSSSQSPSGARDHGPGRVPNGRARSGEIIDLSCDSPLVVSDSPNHWSSRRNYVGSLSGSAAEDEEVKVLYGENAGLRARDKGKGIDLRNMSPCGVEKAGISSRGGCQNAPDYVGGASSTGTSGNGSGEGLDLQKNAELVNGQFRRPRSLQRRLVRNGCISPLNIERSRAYQKQKEVEVQNGGDSSHQVHIISSDSQGRQSDKLKGKARVEDIVASSEQSIKDASHSNRVRLLSGKNACISDVVSSSQGVEDRGWRTTRNRNTLPTWKPASSLMGEESFRHPLNGSNEVTVSNDAQELLTGNRRIDRKRKIGSSGECSSLNSNVCLSTDLESSSLPINSRPTRSRRSQRVGHRFDPVIEVDGLQSSESVSPSVDLDRQVESDEMLARQLQEELYNETPVIRNTEELDVSIALMLQESDELSRRHQSRRRGLTTSLSRTRFQDSVRGTMRSGNSLSSQARTIHRRIMELRLGLLGAATGYGGNASRGNSILHIQRDFNENDYEMLLALDDDNHQHGGASEGQINSLPQSIIQTVDSQEPCAVCLETPAVGDTIRHLPCPHKFHKDCIDTWLRRKRSCPVCKSDIR